MADYPRPDDQVKLTNISGASSAHYTYNGHTVTVRDFHVCERVEADHAVKASLVFDSEKHVHKAQLKIEELPAGQRTKEALGKSADEVKRLGGEIVDYQTRIAELEDANKALVNENAKLRQKIEKLKG